MVQLSLVLSGRVGGIMTTLCCDTLLRCEQGFSEPDKIYEYAGWDYVWGGSNMTSYHGYDCMGWGAAAERWPGIERKWDGVGVGGRL